MKEQAKYCSNCGSIQVKTRTSESYEGIKYQLFCVDCLKSGPWKLTVDQARKAWNKI